MPELKNPYGTATRQDILRLFDCLCKIMTVPAYRQDEEKELLIKQMNK